MEQYKYNIYLGGKGTYVIGGDYYGTGLNVKIFVYDYDKMLYLMYMKMSQRVSKSLYKFFAIILEKQIVNSFSDK